MKYVLILAALGLGSAAVIAGGDAFAHPGGARFERLKQADVNGDGMLSRSEAQALPRLAERFDVVDADRDGQLTRAEMRAARGQAVRGGFMRALDADGDGRVSKAEALAAAEARFNRADANGDGFVSAEEAPARGKRHGHRHHGHGQPPRSGA
jgi:hypothetical protein